MKHRGILAVICLSIVTLGIYDLFWLAKTKKELNARTREHIPSMWMPVLSAVGAVLVGGVIIGFTNAQQQNTGTTTAIDIILNIVAILLIIVGAIVPPVIWLLKYSKAVNEYTSGQISTAVAFILLWILRFIGIAVIQDKFNDMIATGATNGMIGVAPGMMSPMQSNPTLTPTPAASPQQWPAAPQQPVQPQPSMQPQHPIIDPTSPGSYNGSQQTPPMPPTQPPTPPVGPLVQ